MLKLVIPPLPRWDENSRKDPRRDYHESYLDMDENAVVHMDLNRLRTITKPQS